MTEIQGLASGRATHPGEWGATTLPTTPGPPPWSEPTESGLVEEEERRILRQRAHLLAQEPKVANRGEVLVVVEFILGPERYGIDSTLVREVYPLKEYTPLPGTPPFILGLMNVRGQILSITDLSKVFDLPAKGLPNQRQVIILGNGDREFGIVADDIMGMRSIDLGDLQAGLPTLTGLQGEYVKGVTLDRLAVLEGDKLLTDDRLLVQAEVD